MAPIPPTGRASWDPPLPEMAKVGPPADPVCSNAHSNDVSDPADVYRPARAMSSISRACLDIVFFSIHAPRLIRSHSAASFASQGASRGIDLHIRSNDIKPRPRLVTAHGLIVQGMVPPWRCFLPPTIIMASP